nr:PREDICTED: uncharacterized protein LOC103988830 [Musa acuminata subsp. malaccensis]
MEKSNSKRSSSSSVKLKHRFAQLLLGSSCSTTIAAAILGQTSAGPQHPEAEEPGPGRRKHDVGVVHVPIHCSARQVSEQFLPLMTKEEEVEEEGNEKKKERRRADEGSESGSKEAVVQLLWIHQLFFLGCRERAPSLQQRRSAGGRVRDSVLLKELLLRLLRVLPPQQEEEQEEEQVHEVHPAAAEKAREARPRAFLRWDRPTAAAGLHLLEGEEGDAQRRVRGGHAVLRPLQRLPELHGGDDRGARHEQSSRPGAPPQLLPLPELPSPPPSHPRGICRHMGSNLRQIADLAA